MVCETLYGKLTVPKMDGELQKYTYDRRGQLLQVADAQGRVRESYVYDPAGNILQKTVDGKTTQYTYDKANQLVSSETEGHVTNYAYDAAGRLIQEGDKSYTYAWLDKLMSVSEAGKVSANFSYHLDGQIAGVTYADGRSENYLWDGLALIHRDGTELLNEPAVTGGNPVLSGDKVLFNDLLGNTLGVKDQSSYQPIKMTAFGESDNVDAFFTGKPLVGELGYAFLFRNYRPEQGKWQTADPLGYPDGWNNLAYCNNEVTSYIDWLGALKLRSRTVVWAGVSFTHTWIASDDGSTTISGLPSNENYSGGSGSSGSGSSGSGESAGGSDTDPARLVYQENYNLDMNAEGYDEIDIPLNNNQTEQDALNDLKQKAQAYNGNLPYDPLARGDGYNSNSLIAGLLNATGYDGSNLVSSLPGVQPGSDKPVPTHLFE